MPLYTAITQGWPDNIKPSPKLDTTRIKAMVRQGRWADLGQIFGFVPTYVQIQGRTYFNWASPNKEFWAGYQPQKYGPDKWLQVPVAVPRRMKWRSTEQATEKVPHIPPVAVPKKRKSRKRKRKTNLTGETAVAYRKEKLVLYDLQKGRCYYCNKPTKLLMWSIDHLVPRSKGGSELKSNKVGSCYPCNIEKGSLSIEEFMARKKLKTDVDYQTAFRL